MAAGRNQHANRTGVRLKKSVAALWGIVTPKGPSCFWGTLFEIQRNTICSGIYHAVHQPVKRFI